MSSTAAFASPSGLDTDPAGLRPLSGIADMRGGGMPQARVRQILADLVVALSALHAQGRVHGGVSMDTVVRGEADPVRLRDPLGELVPNGEDTLRRPGFAPFEQYTDDPVFPCGPWTDVYSLSALAYALITGAAPPDALSRRVRDAYVPLAGLALRGYDPAFLEGLDASLSMIAALRPQSLEAYDDLLMLPVPTPVAVAVVAAPVAGAAAVETDVDAGMPADTNAVATAAPAAASAVPSSAAPAAAAPAAAAAMASSAAPSAAGSLASSVPPPGAASAATGSIPSSIPPSGAASAAARADEMPAAEARAAASVPPPAARDKSRRASGMGIALVVAILAVAGFLWLRGDEPPAKVASNGATPGSASPAQNQAGQNQAGQGSTQQNSVGQASAGQASQASTPAGQNASGQNASGQGATGQDAPAQAQQPGQAGAGPTAGASTDATPSGQSPFAGMSAGNPQGSANNATPPSGGEGQAGGTNVAAGSTDLPAAPSSAQPAVATSTLNGAKPIPDHRTAPGAATLHDPQATAAAMNAAASAPPASSASAASSSSSASAASPAAASAPATATATAPAGSAGTANGTAMASATPTASTPTGSTPTGSTPAGSTLAGSTLAASTPAPAPKAPVTVNVNIRPWGEVIVDGKSRGISPPLRELKLPPGKHAVVVQNAGLPPYRITLDLTEGRSTSISHVFQ